MTRDIGLDVDPPTETCEDEKCPFHGDLPVRGQVLEGRVAKAPAEHTVVVERPRLWKLPRFERFERRTSRMNVHHPPCIHLTPGDRVTIAECRPLSKTKSFVVVEAREARAEIQGEEAQAPTFGEEEEDEEDDEEGEE